MKKPPLEKLESEWEELEALVHRARRRGVRSMTPDALARMDALYRLTTIHLAQARGRIQDAAIIERLSRLVSSAHSVIYSPARRYPLRTALSFYTKGFPRTVARTGRFHLAALALFLLGGLAGWFVVANEPNGAYMLFDAGEIRLPGSSPEQLQAVLRSGREQSSVEKSLFASFLFTHNTKVGFMAYASGVLAGVLTTYLLLFNGAQLGAFATVHVSKGVGPEMWAWLLPHGITEIGAVILCGGAGLMLGRAVINPQGRSRKQALVQTGRETLLLMLGIIPMFFFAGLIEGHLRQSELSTTARLVFAAGTVLFWGCYFWWGARLLKQDMNKPTAIDDSVL